MNNLGLSLSSEKASSLIYNSKQQQSNIHFLYAYRNHAATQLSVSVSQSHFQILFDIKRILHSKTKSVVCVYSNWFTNVLVITVSKERMIRMGMGSKASYSYEHKWKQTRWVSLRWAPTNTMKLEYSHMRVKDSLHEKCESNRNRYDDLKGTEGTGGVGACWKTHKFSSHSPKSPEYKDFWFS